MKKLFNYIILILIIFNLSSCLKEKDFEFDNIAFENYEGEWAIPLVNSKLSISDFLIDSVGYISVNSQDKFITLVYNTDNLWSAKAEDFIKIQNQSFTFNESVSSPLNVPSGTYFEIKNIQEEITFNSIFNLDSLLFKTPSTIQTIITTNINHQTRYTLKIEQLKDINNKPFEMILNMPYSGSSSYASGSSTFSLNGYKLILNNNNKINISYKLEVFGDEYPFNNGNYDFSITSNFNDIKYKYIVGYFGSFTENLNDSVPLKIFGGSSNNNFSIKSLRAILYTQNSFGIPLRIKTNRFYFYNGAQQRDVISPGYTLNFPYPQIGQFGQTIIGVDTINLDPNFLDISPTDFVFNIDASLNPDNNPSIKNFILDNSQYSVDARVELPLEGKFSKLYFKDTIYFSLSNEYLESLLVKIKIENSFPIDGSLQIFFADTTHAIIDSLFKDRKIIKSATIAPEPNQYTISNGIYFENVILDKSKIIKFAKTKYFIIETSLSSINQGTQNIKIYANQYFDIKIGTRIKLNINP